MENLLTTLASKAPPKLLRELNSQFYKIQREAVMQEDTSLPDDSPERLRSEILRTHHIQMERLEKRLQDAEELNNLYIEDSFELHNQLSKMQEEGDRLKREIQTLTHRNQDQWTKNQDIEQTNLQQFRTKETELATM